VNLQICLFDKQSSQMFWYNVVDGTSQWVASDEQEEREESAPPSPSSALPSPAPSSAPSPAEAGEGLHVPKIVTRKQRRSTVVLSGMQRGRTVVRLRSMGPVASGDDSRSSSFVEGSGAAGEAARVVAKEMEAVQELARSALLDPDPVQMGLEEGGGNLLPS
jgi:hypothetical protein